MAPPPRQRPTPPPRRRHAGRLPRHRPGCPRHGAADPPGLTARPFWPTEALPFASALKAAYPEIKAEFKTCRASGAGGFRPFRQPTWAGNLAAPDGIGGVSHDAGDWNVCYLYLHTEKFPANCAAFPATARLIESLGNRNYCHAFFSALAPGTHIVPHNGPTNKKLRVHLALCGTAGSRLRVGGEVREWSEGGVFIFDDSFEHEAWHDGEETRVVLIIDLWHPDLSDAEVKLMGYLQRAKLR
jgi:aspartate beta-hydroxylase